MKETIPIYLMPGMAASPRIFEFINLPEEFEVVKLSWMPPLQNESLSDFAQRMCERITHKNPILLGVSFGGILVQEMAKLIDCRQPIIVSSVKTKMELPRSMKLAKKTGAHKLLPTQWIKSLESLALYVLGFLFARRWKLIKSTFQNAILPTLDWSIDTIVHWGQTQFDMQALSTYTEIKTMFFPLKILIPVGASIV